jgi:DNA gyrase inhibitor
LADRSQVVYGISPTQWKIVHGNASATARVENHDFATPWNHLFASLLEDKRYQIAPKPCFERYLNDGNADGYWDIEMFVPVQHKAS